VQLFAAAQLGQPPQSPVEHFVANEPATAIASCVVCQQYSLRLKFHKLRLRSKLTAAMKVPASSKAGQGHNPQKLKN
jgi:hypothetical protein